MRIPVILSKKKSYELLKEKAGADSAKVEELQIAQGKEKCLLSILKEKETLLSMPRGKANSAKGEENK
jgi:hypothetical protein